MNAATQLIAYLNRGGPYGYYWIKEPTGRKLTDWFFTDTIPEPPDGSNDVYFGVNPTKYIPERNNRRTGKYIPPQWLRAELKDLAAINCLFAEFDAKQYEGGKAQIYEHINCLMYPPSVLIDSGGGYHAYWLLVNPSPIHDSAALAYYRDLQARWVGHVGGDPDSKDLARVLRVPGTYNYKPTYPEPQEVKIIWADYDMPFELADLARLLPKPREQTPVITPPKSNGNGNGNNTEKDPVRHWVDEALSRVRAGDPNYGRNATGFWLACQLRDDGIDQQTAQGAMLDYRARCPQGDTSGEYTELEALKSLDSAYKLTAREPARKGTSLAIPENGNGHGPAPVTDQVISSPVMSQPPAGNAKNGDAGHRSANGSDNAASDDVGLKTWELVYMDFEKVRESYENQEAGDADLLAAMYRGRICYDHTEGAWYVWRKHFWERDQTGFVYRLVARRVSPQYLHAAADAQSKELEEVAKNLAKRAAALRNKKRMDNVLFLAARHEHLAIKGDEWDANPWLLGCANGVIELRTGTFRPGKPDDYIRAHSPVDWMGIDTQCPRFERFLLEIFNDDQDTAVFMRRLLGFGCSGLTIDHMFPIFWGEGRNGKSTLLEVLGDVLGSDLATSSQADALMDAAKGGDGPKPFIFGLRGKRLVWASESNEGRRINEGLVKQLTGGDRLNVRTLHSKPVEFKPSHLLMLLTNHKPHINADGSAIWDRVYLIPFIMRFIDNPKAENERKRDPNLKETLQAEHPGILAWLVRGFMDYLKDGINPPDCIMNATQAYRDEEDTTGMFIAEKCILGSDIKVKSSALYKEYSDWCKDSGLNPMSITAFGKIMRRRFKAKEEKGIMYYGIGLAFNMPDK